MDVTKSNCKRFLSAVDCTGNSLGEEVYLTALNRADRANDSCVVLILFT